MVDILVKTEPVPPTPTSDVSVTLVDVHDNGTDATDSANDGDSPIQDTQVPDAKPGQTWLTPPPRTKTRLMSRSHSASDLSSDENLKPETEPPRRNSSGEHNQQYIVLAPLSPSNKTTDSQQSLTVPSNKLFDNVILTENKPPSPVPIVPNPHLSPISFQQHQVHQNWKPPKSVPTQEDTFTLLLHTTAERVLTKLKSRQQDLGKNMQTGRKVKKQQPGMHQAVPRKLQPILRDGTKTPLTRPDSNFCDQKNDSDTSSIFSAT